MNLLLLGAGGGGGNILRSVKALFERDLEVAQATDPAYAERLRRAINTRFLDTNEFSLSDIPVEERLLIGAPTTARLGARHNPDVARQALEESRAEIEEIVRRHSAVIVIGTGGKGTGAGTVFPLAEMARQQRKLVLPIFVRPSFERHEVDKRRYDHALAVVQQFEGARMRLVEILNDRGYDDADPQPQGVVWERMNLPIARALRGLMYVLWDLSQVDPSDLSTLLAGPGRLRIGFGEIDPAAHVEPTGEQVEQAVRECWVNSFFAFSKPAGTSLICIQGDWSNVADSRIKGGLATLAAAGAATAPYNPLYTRAARAPKPWGVTALFAEFTGVHPPIDIDWSLDGDDPQRVDIDLRRQPAMAPGPVETVSVTRQEETPRADVAPDTHVPSAAAPAPAFASLWEFAVAVNRSNPVALALAQDVIPATMPIEGAEVRRLLATVWFRTVVPRLSSAWRSRLLDAFVTGATVTDYVVRMDRRSLPLSQLTYRQLQTLSGKLSVPDVVRPDLDLLVAIGRLWGEDAVARVRFTDVPHDRETSRLSTLLGALRS